MITPGADVAEVVRDGAPVRVAYIEEEERAALRVFMRARGQSEFVDNLCRQLLIYALGRSLLLSDEPLVQRMNTRLAASGYRFSVLVDAIVASPQFLNRRTAESTIRKVAN